MITVYILVTTMIYLILLIFVYFSKKRVLTIENKIFKFLLVSNLIGIILDVTSIIIIPLKEYELLSLIINKMYLIYLFTWITLFTFYTYFISNYDKKLILNNIRLLRIVYYLIAAIIFALPLEFVVSEKGIYSYGAGTLFMYLYSILCIFAMIMMISKNIKKIGKNKYIPLFVFFGIGSIAILIQSFNPYLLLITAVESFVTFLTYFTIENPDLQIIEEYREIKNLAHKQHIDKVMFLHNVNQSLKYDLLQIERDVNYLSNEIDDPLYDECLNDISFKTKKMLSKLNNVYDLNGINESNIKVFNDNYETKIFASMFKSYRNLIPKEIDYEYTIDHNIPEYLYGDILNIKDILKRIMQNLVCNIDSGKIKLELSVVLDNNVCRLIITINDNGKGYTYKEIDDSFKDGIFKQFVDDLVKINGTFIINSEKGSTERIIVIDEIISLNKMKKIEKLENNSNQKKVMVVDNSNEMNKIVKLIDKYHDVLIVPLTLGVDCLKRIRDYEKFDLIILNEELEPINGIETYKKLKENITFKTPVIILSKQKDFKIKKEYLELGISDIVSMPIQKEEFKEVIDKYLR